MQLIEDAQRKELSDMERAWAYATAIANINIGGNFTLKQVKEMKHGPLINLLMVNVKDSTQSAFAASACILVVVGHSLRSETGTLE